MARKSFDLDDDVAALLIARKEKGSYGNSENKVINSLLRNIPRQEAELLKQVGLVEAERTQKDDWSRRAVAAEKELQQIKTALSFVGQLLHPPIVE